MSKLRASRNLKSAHIKFETLNLCVVRRFIHSDWIITCPSRIWPHSFTINSFRIHALLFVNTYRNMYRVTHPRTHVSHSFQEYARFHRACPILFHFMAWTKQNTPVSVWQQKYQSIYNCCNSYMILPDLLPFASDYNRSIFRYLFTTYLAPHDQE
jgi:hypothetical protein